MTRKPGSKRPARLRTIRLGWTRRQSGARQLGQPSESLGSRRDADGELTGILYTARLSRHAPGRRNACGERVRLPRDSDGEP